MINFKDIRKKLLKGDFSGLLGLLRLNGSRKKVGIHPAEVAQIFDPLPDDTSVQAYLTFGDDQKLVVFPYLDISLQRKIIRHLPKDKASYILNEIPSDDRNIFYSHLKGVELTYFLDFLNEENRRVVHDIMGYPENSVARMLNTDFASVYETMTIAQASEYLRKTHDDTENVNVLYVVDKNGRLLDDIPVRRLVLNEQHKTIAEIMDGFVVTLNIADPKEEAVAKFKEYDRASLPVINKDNVLLGVVTMDDVLDVAEQTDTAAIQKFGGVEELDYPYVKTPFFSLIKKRAGWLIVLFLGEMLTATAMGYFDKEISKAVVLALFVPLIISSGGNSGSQAATLIIRAMALKELTMRDWWYVMRREILSGLFLGVILGSIGLLRISVWQNLHWFDYGPQWLLVAITIFFSLIGIVMWGTLSGSMIPIVLKRFNIDPATSSAPFVATLVDVTGLVIYFTIAASILKGTLL